MSFQFIKKEEPVEFVLVATEQGQIIHQQTFNQISNCFIRTDVNVKQEPDLSEDEVDDDHDQPPLSNDCYEIDGMDNEVPETKPIIHNGHHSESENGAEAASNVSTNSSMVKKSKSKAQSYSRPRNYECEKCGVTFTLKSYYLNHAARHKRPDIDQCKICKLFFHTSVIQFHTDSHNGPPYTCKVCFKTFAIKQSWNHHRFVHDKENVYECDICGKCVKSKNSMLEHLKTHQERQKRFICEICQLSFFRKPSLSRHIRKSHGNLLHKCSNILCYRGLMNRSLLESHKCRIRQTILPNQPSNTNVVKESTDWKRYPCEKCKKTFYKLDRYVMHVAQNCSDPIIYECDYCSKLLSPKEALMKHFRYCRKAVELHKVHHKPCPVCNRLFSNEKKLEKHVKSRRCTFQTEEERAVDGFICNKCKKIFRNLDRLVLHVEQNCSEQIRYQCDYCSKSFSEKYRLLQHFSGQHKIVELKRESCQLCHKLFLNKSKLKIHLNSVNHKDLSKTSQCLYCNQIFSQLTGLKIHLKQCISRKSNQKYAEYLTESMGQHFENYTCDICKCIFVQKSYIVEHMLLVHSKNELNTKKANRRGIGKFSCPACNRAFQKQDLLQRHIHRIHSDARKSFVCDVCNQIFVSEKLYAKHIKILKCKNKIQCTVCSKMFAHKSSLRRHSKYCRKNQDILVKI